MNDRDRTVVEKIELHVRIDGDGGQMTAFLSHES